jgi:small subunit ribosomal protein S2
MALPDFSMRQLLEAGVHFGHQKHRWNPKMERFIFGVRNDIHILDLSQTVPMLSRALQLISDTVADGGRVLFVGTKRQAAPVVAEAARQSAQYFVNSRWLGGTLTNWQTISHSIARLRELEAQEAEGMDGLTKKERLMLSREKERLERDLGGIKDMGNLPNLLFVIDTNREAIAIKEAHRLGIPVVAIELIGDATWAIDRAVEPGGLLLLGWRLNRPAGTKAGTAAGTDTVIDPTSVDSYFRFSDPADRRAISEAVTSITARTPGVAGTTVTGTEESEV